MRTHLLWVGLLVFFTLYALALPYLVFVESTEAMILVVGVAVIVPTLITLLATAPHSDKEHE